MQMVLDLPRSLTGFGCMLIVVRLGLITFMREIEIEILKWIRFSQLAKLINCSFDYIVVVVVEVVALWIVLFSD